MATASDPVIFNPLQKDDIARIVRLQLIEVFDRVRDRGIQIEIAEDAVEFLMTKGFNPDYGARPMRRAIERYIEDPLAEKFLQPDFDAQRPVLVTVEGPVEDAEELTFLQTERPDPDGPEAPEGSGDAPKEAPPETESAGTDSDE